MGEPTPKYSDADLQGDGVSKKEICAAIQEHAAHQFLVDHKLKGALKNVVKTKQKDALIADYKELYETKAFKGEGDAEDAAKGAAAAALKDVTDKTKKMSVEEKDDGPPKYTKNTMKKGDKQNYPKKGDSVLVYYCGKFDDGKVFDNNDEMKKNQPGKRKHQPLKFKVGLGKVIKAWDHALMQMSVNEKVELTVQPEWGYGRRGLESSPGIYIVPPNTTLHFEMELVAIE